METQRNQLMTTTIKSLPYYGLQHLFLVVASLFLIIGLLAAKPARADINSVNANPNTATIPVSTSYTLPVNWTVSRTESDRFAITPTTRLVSSASASLVINGVTIANIGGNLSTTSVLSFTQTGSVTITESIQLNTAQLRAIAKSAPGAARIVRTFTDTQTSASGSIMLYAGSLNTQDLIIKRIDLSFESRSRTDIVKQNDVLHAVADISFLSSGLLRGEWRLIDPSTSHGSQAGRVLQVVRQNLVSSGQGRTRLASPQLPTDRSGLYMLAFAVEQDSNNTIEIPILRYFVIDNGAQSVIEPLPMISFTPSENAVLDNNTVFSWAAVDNAKAYQVEVFTQGKDLALTGKLVPAAVLKLNLSAMSLDWLQSSSEYLWHVKAINSQGQVIAVSEKKPVHTP